MFGQPFQLSSVVKTTGQDDLFKRGQKPRVRPARGGLSASLSLKRSPSLTFIPLPSPVSLRRKCSEL